jgi:hypothetical protein
MKTDAVGEYYLYKFSLTSYNSPNIYEIYNVAVLMPCKKTMKRVYFCNLDCYTNVSSHQKHS